MLKFNIIMLKKKGMFWIRILTKHPEINWLCFSFNFLSECTFHTPVFDTAPSKHFEENIPDCILSSDNFNQSLDQFYYSFLYIVVQDCSDLNDDNFIDILDIWRVFENSSTQRTHGCVDLDESILSRLLDVASADPANSVPGRKSARPLVDLS